jgi:hypothetical protein
MMPSWMAYGEDEQVPLTTSGGVSGFGSSFPTLLTMTFQLHVSQLEMALLTSLGYSNDNLSTDQDGLDTDMSRTIAGLQESVSAGVRRLPGVAHHFRPGQLEQVVGESIASWLTNPLHADILFSRQRLGAHANLRYRQGASPGAEALPATTIRNTRRLISPRRPGNVTGGSIQSRTNTTQPATSERRAHTLTATSDGQTLGTMTTDSGYGTTQGNSTPSMPQEPSQWNLPMDSDFTHLDFTSEFPGYPNEPFGGPSFLLGGLTLSYPQEIQVPPVNGPSSSMQASAFAPTYSQSNGVHPPTNTRPDANPLEEGQDHFGEDEGSQEGPSAF